MSDRPGALLKLKRSCRKQWSQRVGLVKPRTLPPMLVKPLILLLVLVTLMILPLIMPLILPLISE